MSGRIRIPPSGCRSLKSSCSIQDLLSVVALTGSEHLQHCLQPIFSFKWISGMSEHGRMVTHKLPMLVVRRVERLGRLVQADVELKGNKG
jgi:hypothetical protein